MEDGYAVCGGARRSSCGLEVGGRSLDVSQCFNNDVNEVVTKKLKPKVAMLNNYEVASIEASISPLLADVILNLEIPK